MCNTPHPHTPTNTNTHPRTHPYPPSPHNHTHTKQGSLRGDAFTHLGLSLGSPLPLDRGLFVDPAFRGSLTAQPLYLVLPNCTADNGTTLAFLASLLRSMCIGQPCVATNSSNGGGGSNASIATVSTLVSGIADMQEAFTMTIGSLLAGPRGGPQLLSVARGVVRGEGTVTSSSSSSSSSSMQQQSMVNTEQQVVNTWEKLDALRKQMQRVGKAGRNAGGSGNGGIQSKDDEQTPTTHDDALYNSDASHNEETPTYAPHIHTSNSTTPPTPPPTSNFPPVPRRLQSYTPLNTTHASSGTLPLECATLRTLWRTSPASINAELLCGFGKGACGGNGVQQYVGAVDWSGVGVNALNVTVWFNTSNLPKNPRMNKEKPERINAVGVVCGGGVLGGGREINTHATHVHPTHTPHGRWSTLRSTAGCSGHWGHLVYKFHYWGWSHSPRCVLLLHTVLDSVDNTSMCIICVCVVD